MIGVERNEIQKVYETWPFQTVDWDEFRCALMGSMGMLIGYSHHKEDELLFYVSEGRAAIIEVLDHLHALGF